MLFGTCPYVDSVSALTAARQLQEAFQLIMRKEDHIGQTAIWLDLRAKNTRPVDQIRHRLLNAGLGHFRKAHQAAHLG